ncbi:MAG: response regulator [Anaerolineae bacterium]|nr:response regulator [Anaerolineae bacterium]
MATKRKRTVLIVDDESLTCDMLKAILMPEGYDTILATSGTEALKVVEQQPPDIILLDVMMPDIDGLEVCRRLKANKRWQHIPIILVTVLDSTEDLVNGLDAGADDFVNKPVNGVELRARIRSLLRLKEQYDELEATLRMREDLTHMIVHDIRTPLTAILGYTQLLLARESFPDSDAQDVQAIQMQAYRLDSFLNDMLILAKLEAERLILNRSMVDVNQVVQQVIGSYNIVARSKNIKLIGDLPTTTQHILLDTNLFQRVLENLISNALKFSPAESTITVLVEYPRAKTMLSSAGPQIRVTISDEGPGITIEDRERIFDKFEVAKLQDKEDRQIGLGLAFCKMVVEGHGGYISVRPNKPVGSIFTIEI